MTQAADTDTYIAEQLSAIRSTVNNIDAEVSNIKVAQARTEEQLKALNAKLSTDEKNTASKLQELKDEIKSQGSRLWIFFTTLFISLAAILVGVVIKFVFTIQV